MAAVAVDSEQQLPISPKMTSEMSELISQQHPSYRITCTLFNSPLQWMVHTAFSITRRLSRTRLCLSQPGQRGGSLQPWASKGERVQKPCARKPAFGEERIGQQQIQNPIFTLGEFLTNTFQGIYHSECPECYSGCAKLKPMLTIQLWARPTYWERCPPCGRTSWLPHRYVQPFKSAVRVLLPRHFCSLLTTRDCWSGDFSPTSLNYRTFKSWHLLCCSCSELTLLAQKSLLLASGELWKWDCSVPYTGLFILLCKPCSSVLEEFS